ncbi:RagB/SusD family nutrient uptake outer membrane protein [Massilibacteroides sp.]|uniref:RagB/SusD family nutrient uptake outer membrane protein n=1 Tax=Massilibacteroides sp. TaxID=2034766 RepID=UPI00261C1CC0|nr:RagB/SusD family nutrient uptake outer membrane protein [Massilibacteroides sp.]MDD4516171.1 RagB/SusD family nutrient uptake outer membrane protein [Massilibacteroides sp.]
MKKTGYAIIIIIPLLSACADLDITPDSSIDKNQFYQSEADALTAVNGIYAELTPPSGFYGMYNNQTVYLGDLASEYVKAGANTNSAHIREIGNFTISSNNDFMRCAWSEAYTGINRANIVIDRLSEPSSSISSEIQNRLVNEAKFLRALFYFNIVRWWGAVPLILHDGEGEGQERTPVDEVYSQIVKDLEDATALSQEYHSEGRATGGAALATLSKVYLTWAQTDSPEGKAKQTDFYRKSLEYADRVIDSGNYRLVQNVWDLFATDKKNGVEHIFSVQHAQLSNVSGHCVFAMGWSDSEPVLIVNDVKYYNQIDDADQRKNGAFAKSLWNPNTNSRFTYKVPLFRKYIDTLNYDKDQFAGRNMNFAYIRYAEVLLIKAEVENELNGPTAVAYDAINQVRRRAYNQPVSSASPYDLSGLTKDEFREKLQAERFTEFILEGTHWFDLVRWRKLIQTVRPQKPNVTAKHYLFPLPQQQLNLNPNLTQNWGYESEDGTNPYASYEPGYSEN